MRLRTARLTDETLVSQIDDYTAELESDIAQILGVTLDSPITATAFDISNDGKILKALARFRAVRPAFQITNATNGNQVGCGWFRFADAEGGSLLLLGFVPNGNSFSTAEGGVSRNTTFGGFTLIPGNLADGGDPTWQLLGSLFTGASAGLVPRGSGNSYEFLCSDGRWLVPGHPSDSVLLHDAVNSALTNQGLVVGTTYDLFWQSEDFDPQTLHATNDDEIIIETAGKYIVTADISVEVGDPEAGTCSLRIFRDRAAVDTQWAETSEVAEVSDGVNQLNAEALIDCNVGDKLYAQLTYSNASGNPDVFSISHGFLGAHRIL